MPHTDNFNESGFVSVADAARYLALSKTAVYDLLNAGRLPSAKFGKARRIPKDGLVAFAKAQTLGG